jgi:hypothetical protein
MMVAAEANRVFKRAQLNFFAASIEVEKLEALAVNKTGPEPSNKN